jgi:4,5-DOPA dioxygenase extradiol
MNLSDLHSALNVLPYSERMPTLFIGHGSPMNAVEDNMYTRGWKAIASTLPTPRAILVISAHWLTKGTFVGHQQNPKTIYDFSGFPEQLYHIRYPVEGAPRYAEATCALTDGEVELDTTWGIDHGAWVPLLHLFPNANIPVYQLSLDVMKHHEQHFALGDLLRPLRERGVLIVASGNIVHNLGMINWQHENSGFDWAEEFDTQVSKFIVARKFTQLVNYPSLGPSASLAVPTPEHYWPLLYTLALAEENEPMSFPVTGLTMGSISMRSVKIG